MFTYIIEIALSVLFAGLIWRLIVEFFRVFKILKDGYKEREMEVYVPLDEIYDKLYNNDHKGVKQVVYKVDGDLNGNVKGDNVTVILMGDGDINGNIDSDNGNVVLIKGNINGNVKADKIVCPCPDDTKKQKHGINIKSYSVILPMYVKQSGYINVPIHLEFTDNGELIGIKQIQK